MNQHDEVEFWVVWEKPAEHPEEYWAELMRIEEGNPEPVKVGRSVNSRHLHLVEQHLEDTLELTQLRRPFLTGDKIVGNWG